MIVLTDRAREALLGSLTAARRFDGNVQLRVLRQGDGLRTVFAEELDPSDQRIDLGPSTIAFEAGIDGTVDAGEHNQLTVAPP
jgi:hypothetical protein